VPSGFLNAFQPTAVSVKRVKIAGAAGARAANIVTDGQLFSYLKTFNENIPPTHRVIHEHIDYVIYVESSSLPNSLPK
jgi:hypothetical protein